MATSVKDALIVSGTWDIDSVNQLIKFEIDLSGTSMPAGVYDLGPFSPGTSGPRPLLNNFRTIGSKVSTETAQNIEMYGLTTEFVMSPVLVPASIWLFAKGFVSLFVYRKKK